MNPWRPLLRAAAEQVVSSSAYVTALLSLAGVLIAAVIAGLLKLQSDQVARRAAAQRDALMALQDGALDLRAALRNYGDGLPRPNDALERSLDLANGRLDLLVQRVDKASLRHVVEDWRILAQQFWLEDESVTVSQEDVAWKRIHYYAGEELRLLDRLSLLQDRRFKAT